MSFVTHAVCPALKPLLNVLREEIDIRGVKAGQEEHKVAAYADDILLCVTNPRISILNIILKELKEYGELSNFKINSTKSEILNIGLDK